MFSEPVPLPPGANCLPLIWTYLIKLDGTKKSRCVCNGSKHQTGRVTIGETYAGNVDQYSSKVFWAGTAIHNYITIGADITNAFAEAPPPTAPLYVYVDDVYREWRRARGLSDIPKGYVLQVQKGIQGHPEAPRLWEKHIDKVLRNKGLVPSKHEPCLYSGTYNGEHVLFLRQVDDFAISSRYTKTCYDLIADINRDMKTKIKELGILTRFNGTDILQSRNFVKISNKTYIEKISKGKNINQQQAAFPIPMISDTKYQENIETAEPANDDELLELEKKYKFSYRQIIGELIYAMVTCRPDISYPLIKLSQYCTTPSKLHFEAAQQILDYLVATKDDGIYYWRQQPNLKLPYHQHQEPRDTNQIIPIDANATSATTFVDSDWGGDRHHRKSTTGYTILIAGGAVLYKTKFQSTIALSSTEAEFVSACDAGRCSLFIRSLLNHIQIPQDKATIIYEDNNGSILMANAGKPTRRARHLDLKHFAIQDWIEKDLLYLKWISTTNNCSDSLTKALGRILQYKHMDYIMGRVRPKYSHMRDTYDQPSPL